MGAYGTLEYTWLLNSPKILYVKFGWVWHGFKGCMAGNTKTNYVKFLRANYAVCVGKWYYDIKRVNQVKINWRMEEFIQEHYEK